MSNETPPTVVWAELLRRAQANQTSSFYQFCQTCGARQRWVLVAEIANQETYRCEGCGTDRSYTVR